MERRSPIWAAKNFPPHKEFNVQTRWALILIAVLMMTLIAFGCNSEKSSADIKPAKKAAKAQSIEPSKENTITIAFGNDNEGELAPCG